MAHVFLYSMFVFWHAVSVTGPRFQISTLGPVGPEPSRRGSPDLMDEETVKRPGPGGSEHRTLRSELRKGSHSGCFSLGFLVPFQHAVWSLRISWCCNCSRASPSCLPFFFACNNVGSRSPEGATTLGKITHASISHVSSARFTQFVDEVLYISLGRPF